MRLRDPYGEAVSAIRTQMRSGAFVLGEQLTAAEVSRSLNLSQTPVREAFARLAGEGLIDERRGAGFFAWRLDAVDLVELYDLQATYLRAALAPQFPQGPGRWGAAADLVESLARSEPLAATEQVFQRLVQEGRNLALQRAHLLLADRLAPPRRAEAEVLALAALGEEWGELGALLRGCACADLLIWVEQYHQSRRHRAPEIVSAMRSRAKAGHL
ncbi:GntR family transcriptional regulator [Phenylobacterium sp.]|uniref:GntR family transcriptional regulator n=1 Tax=Phenylobacterium sp. TaxID=1871053 RepID=UPI00272FB9F6|nr:GntR family transcriptional regulator [Phenylobacterium sp.]MDP1875194.1 GntR family transcriptional regulator [Phenylobacterium sp.]